MSTSPRQGWGWFLAWAGVGVGAAFSVLGMLTIGSFIAIPTVVAAVLLLRAAVTGRVMLGALTGVGLTLLWIGATWRSSPAVCSGSTDAAGGECAEVWNWPPWVIPGLVLVAAGVIAHAVLAARAKGSDDAEPPHVSSGS